MSGTKLRFALSGALALLLLPLPATLVVGCTSEEPAPAEDDDRKVPRDDDDDTDEDEDDAGDSDEAPANRDDDDADDSDVPDEGSDEGSGDQVPIDKGDGDMSKGNPPAASPSVGSDALWCKTKAVLTSRCTSCHDGKGTAGTPNGINFAEHADLLGDSPDVDGAKMFERIGVRIHPETSGLGPMPPKNPLTEAQIADIDAWVAAGAPNADDCSETQPPVGNIGPDGRPISIWDESICDEIYKITVPAIQVPASPEETYRQIDIDAPWGNEEVQVINQRPITDNGPVLHHWILYDKAGPFLTGWAPGDEERRPLPEHVGMRMPSGPASMYMDMHYYNRTGKAQVDSSGVELCIVKGKNLRPNSSGITMGFSQLAISIPPGATEHSVKGTCTINASQPIHIMTASPHAHRLAKRMVFKVQKKDGTIIDMLDEKFTFGEQASYPLEEYVTVESGDQILTECIYANDTNAQVTFGESNNNEMCFNFASYYPIGGFCCEELGLESCLLGGVGVGGGGLGGIDLTSIFGS